MSRAEAIRCLGQFLRAAQAAALMCNNRFKVYPKEMDALRVAIDALRDMDEVDAEARRAEG